MYCTERSTVPTTASCNLASQHLFHPAEERAVPVRQFTLIQMMCRLQLGLAFCGLLIVFAAAQDPTVSLDGVQDLSELHCFLGRPSILPLVSTNLDLMLCSP